jgi:hypothetical protein
MVYHYGFAEMLKKMSWGNVDEAVSFKKENNGVRSVSSNWWLFF